MHATPKAIRESCPEDTGSGRKWRSIRWLRIFYQWPGSGRKDDMQAVILTGGLGTRLRPITRTIPKGLVTVGGKPFLEHLIFFLKKSGIGDILLCVGYLGERIEEYFKDGSAFGLRIDYSREDRPRGTGGALKLALPRMAEEFFLLNGDTYLPADLALMKKVFSGSKTAGLIGVYPVVGTEIEANLRVEKGGRISGCAAGHEPKGLDYADAGIRIFRREIADFFPPTEKFSLEADVYPRLIKAGRLKAWPIKQRFYDIGTPARLREFENYLKNRSHPSHRSNQEGAGG